MSGVAVLLHQFRFDQKVFWRNPAAVFFTALLPLIFLFMLATVFKNSEISGLDVKGATYYVPAILTLAVISATTVKLATNLPAEREAGQLKRVRGTPLPPAAFVAGRLAERQEARRVKARAGFDEAWRTFKRAGKRAW